MEKREQMWVHSDFKKLVEEWSARYGLDRPAMTFIIAEKLKNQNPLFITESSNKRKRTFRVEGLGL